MQEWLRNNKLESMEGALRQLGVESLEHLYTLQEQVSTTPQGRLAGSVVCPNTARSREWEHVVVGRVVVIRQIELQEC